MRLSNTIAMLLLLCSGALHAESMRIPLDQEAWKEVSFDDIPKTTYEFRENTIKMGVKKSSSFLLLPFSEIKNVKSVQFEWKSTGKLNVSSPKIEQSKKGDDFFMKLGLVLSGDAPFIPFFAPSWIKAIRNIAKLPSDKVLYLVSGTKTPPGNTWESPYTSDLTYRSLESKPTSEKPWLESSYSFTKPMAVVGLWLMADGDNSQSEFQSTIRNIQLTFETSKVGKP